MCNIVLCNLYITLTRKFYYFVFCKVTQAQLCVTNKQNEFLKSSDRYLIFFKKFIQNVINQKTIWNPISILENLISSVTIFKKKKFIYISIYPSINIFTCQNTRDSILQYWKNRLSRMRKSKNDSSFQTQCNIAEIFQSKFLPPSISSTLFSHSQRLYVFQTNTHFETNAENLEKPTSYNKNVQQQEQKPITRTGIVREIAHGVKS